MPQSEKQSAEWLEGVRIGGIQAISHFRVLLHQRKPLSDDDRQGLIDLLDYMVEHLQVMWEFVEDLVPAEVQHLSVTELNTRKLRTHATDWEA